MRWQDHQGTNRRNDRVHTVAAKTKSKQRTYPEKHHSPPDANNNRNQITIAGKARFLTGIADDNGYEDRAW